LIYPTKAISEWIKDNKSKLDYFTQCKFYIALTRVRYSVGIVYDYQDSDNFDGMQKYCAST
jgi:DNA helicase-2/ATP-dependent DNA helicase PcrA